MEKTTKKIFEAGLPEMNEKKCSAPVECDANSLEKNGKAKEVSFSAFAENYKLALIEKVRNFENRETLHMFHEIRKAAINNGLFDKSDYSKVKEYTKGFTARFILPAKDNTDEKENIIESGSVGATVFKIVKIEKVTAKDIITSVNNLARAGVIRFGEKKELNEDDKIKVNTLVNTLRPLPEESWDQICAICKFSTRVRNAAYEILKAK